MAEPNLKFKGVQHRSNLVLGLRTRWCWDGLLHSQKIIIGKCDLQLLCATWTREWQRWRGGCIVASRLLSRLLLLSLCPKNQSKPPSLSTVPKRKPPPQSCPKTSPDSFSQSLFLSLFLLLFHPLCFSESSLKDLALKRNTWEFPPKPVPYFLVGKLVGREMNSYEERES